MEQKKHSILNTKYIDLKNLLISKKYKETENIVKKELSINENKLDAQLWVFLGEALMYQGFGKIAAKVFNRAWLLDPNAQWVEGVKRVLENIEEGSEREDIVNF